MEKNRRSADEKTERGEKEKIKNESHIAALAGKSARPHGKKKSKRERGGGTRCAPGRKKRSRELASKE